MPLAGGVIADIIVRAAYRAAMKRARSRMPASAGGALAATAVGASNGIGSKNRVQKPADETARQFRTRRQAAGSRTCRDESRINEERAE